MRKIKNKMFLKDIVIDEELYPRNDYSWQVAYDYSESMNSGANFPNIVVAKHNDVFILVDGRHRLEATKVFLGRKKFKEHQQDVEVLIGLSKQKIYEEAVKRNISHGRSLSVQEKLKIASQLSEYKYSLANISRIIQIPANKLINLQAKRITNTLTGEEVVLKKTFENIVDTAPRTDIDLVQHKSKGIPQINLINELIILIKSKSIDLKNKNIKTKLIELKELLAKLK